MNKQYELPQSEFAIASLVCGAFGIPGDEDENVYKMIDLIPWDEIKNADWILE